MDKYIKMLADESRTKSHELIEECIDYYGVLGTCELTQEQVRQFCRIKGLNDKQEEL